MTAARRIKTTAPAILPLIMLLVPKCPLCLLPFFVAAWLTIPSRGLLDGLLVAAVAAWLALLTNATRSIAVLAPAFSGAAVSLCGRWLDFPAAAWAGAALMLGAAVGAASRKRSCRAAAVHEA